ncbi:Cupin domain protein [Natronorubrum sediminis]|uniref:Cupin domain protein n=1 Tax=Natronorubrum sediminis TaxID=640943 RepID=A0A1H6G141_9EURY|nr:cupin [Natronorubrum sediminis]SEH15993.1 Cupin domain protein [Natronorubrum sediminis]
MTTKLTPKGGILRRTVLKASAVAAGAVALSGTTAGDEHDVDDDENDEAAEVDEPDGFEVEIIQEHASFADSVAAAFEVTYDDVDEPIVVDLEDASTVILAEATWEEDAESGWHRHPGMSIVRMIEGEIEHTMEDDCVSRTYSAGDAWIDPGHVHKADSEEGALAHVTFLGIPDGEPATEWVEAVEC